MEKSKLEAYALLLGISTDDLQIIVDNLIKVWEPLKDIVNKLKDALDMFSTDEAIEPNGIYIVSKRMKDAIKKYHYIKVTDISKMPYLAKRW